MKTPTVKFVPGVIGPSEGALVGQLVAVVEAVIQTGPVNYAWALGITYEGTNSEAARTMGSNRTRRLFKRLIKSETFDYLSLLIFSFNARPYRLWQSRAISGYEEPSRVIQSYRKRTISRILAGTIRLR